MSCIRSPLTYQTRAAAGMWPRGYCSPSSWAWSSLPYLSSMKELSGARPRCVCRPIVAILVKSHSAPLRSSLLLAARRDVRNFSVLVTGVLAATVVSIGLVAYWGCPSTAEESRFWTPLTFALNLLVGNIQECSVGPEARPAPLALQLPRLLGPLLLVIAAFGIVASIFRAQSDRILVRLSRSLVVLVGLTEDAMPLVRRLSTEREADTTLTVLVSDPGNT